MQQQQWQHSYKVLTTTQSTTTIVYNVKENLKKYMEEKSNKNKNNNHLTNSRNAFNNKSFFTISISNFKEQLLIQLKKVLRTFFDCDFCSIEKAKHMRRDMRGYFCAQLMYIYSTTAKKHRKSS